MLAGSISIANKKVSRFPVQPSGIVLFNTYSPCIFESDGWGHKNNTSIDIRG